MYYFNYYKKYVQINELLGDVQKSVYKRDYKIIELQSNFSTNSLQKYGRSNHRFYYCLGLY